MTEDQKFKCAAIIHGASASAGAIGAGLAQVPGADAAVIMPLQVAMVAALGHVFDLEVTETASRSVVYATLGSMLGRGAVKVLPRLIPGVGNVVCASVAFGITETIGWSVARQMEAGTFGGTPISVQKP